MSGRGARAAAAVLAIAVAGIGLPPAAASGASHPRVVTVGRFGTEPIVKVARDGTLYISAWESLYRSTDNGRHWVHLPGPTLTKASPEDPGFGTDSSISVDPGGRLYMAFDLATEAAMVVCTSDDRGDSWLCNPEVAIAHDRPWLATPTSSSAFLAGIGPGGTIGFTSDDRGLVWAPDGDAGTGAIGSVVALPGGDFAQAGYVDDVLYYGLVIYQYHRDGTVTSEPVGETPPFDNDGLPNLAVTPDGTLFSAADLPYPTLLRRSNRVPRWEAINVPTPAPFGSARYATVAAATSGHVGVLYYWTSGNTNDWSVVWSETRNGESQQPRWTTQIIERHAFRDAMPNPKDFVTAAFDRFGHADLTWVDGPIPTPIDPLWATATSHGSIRFARL